jgi:hypothetical protein
MQTRINGLFRFDLGIDAFLPIYHDLAIHSQKGNSSLPVIIQNGLHFGIAECQFFRPAVIGNLYGLPNYRPRYQNAK